MIWKVYLSGEIHSDWRQQLIDGALASDLPVTFTSAVTDHESSDAADSVQNKMPSGETTNRQKLTRYEREPIWKIAISQSSALERSLNNGMLLLMRDFVLQRASLI